jgi:hypothetical protein
MSSLSWNRSCICWGGWIEELSEDDYKTVVSYAGYKGCESTLVDEEDSDIHCVVSAPSQQVTEIR